MPQLKIGALRDLIEENAEIIYKIVWGYYLIWHNFFSTSAQVLPLSFRLAIFLTGWSAIAFYEYDSKNYFFCAHKLLFIILNIYPFNIDNRVTLAIFESVVFIMSVGFFKNHFRSLAQPFRMLLVLTFFFAGFHKLNEHHLYSLRSCSRTLFFDHGISPWLVVGIELGISFLLLRKKFILPSLILFSLPLAFLGFHQFMAIIWVISIPVLIFSKSEQKNKLTIPIMVLFSLNCLAPFTGLKNAGSMNMYSNLNVGSDRTNHLLWQRPLHFSDNVSDTVTILESKYPFHQRGLVLPRKLLRQQIRFAEALGYSPAVKYLDQGKIIERTTAEDWKEFIMNLSWFDYVFLSLAPTENDSRSCLW